MIDWRCAIVLCSVLPTSACVPGGLIMPAPVGHTDRPAIGGRLHFEGAPLEGVRINAAVDDDACDAPDATTTTDADGNFRLAEDFSYYTLFWTDQRFDLSICIRPEDRPLAATFAFRKSDRTAVTLDCELRADESLLCRRV